MLWLNFKDKIELQHIYTIMVRLRPQTAKKIIEVGKATIIQQSLIN